MFVRASRARGDKRRSARVPAVKSLNGGCRGDAAADDDDDDGEVWLSGAGRGEVM